MPLLALLFSFSLSLSAEDVCEKWFLDAGIKPGTEDCKHECLITVVDMGTFTCPNDCEKLCKTVVPSQLVETLSYITKLNEGDKAVIAKYPKEALKVYQAKQKVDSLTGKVFGKAKRNDESDAFRHFVWSSLLTKELGEKKARIFLDAHEQEPDQPLPEKKMDQYNNEQGIKFAKKRLKKGKLELNEIEKEALKRLRLKRLKVLKPSRKSIPKGYYSE